MKKFILAVMVLLTCVVLSGCGTAEFSLKMAEGNGTSLHLKGEYRANTELYYSGFDCTYFFRNEPYKYGITFDTGADWVWPGPTNPMQAMMHPNIFGEEIDIGEWTLKYTHDTLHGETIEHQGVHDTYMKVVVNPGLTVEDIWTKNIGNVQSSAILQQAYQQYQNGDTSVIDQWMFQYRINMTFAAPVTVLSGSQWVTQNGYTISFDLGKMMQAGGGEFMLISSMTQKDLSGTKEDPNYTEPVEEPKPMKEFNFTDVPKTYWAYDAIQYCANNEYISGYSDGSFKPNGNVTFAHLSKMLYFSGYNIERIAKIIDVNHYANPFMGWCVYRDIFLPEDIMTDGEVTAKQIDQTMTREQVTHALVQYAEWRGAAMTKPEVNIPDIDSVSPQYREAVQKAYRYGITNGKDASYTFGPKDSVTRAQVCKMLQNMSW